ncbi:unnamed protein product [Caenorhabditis brenneri]
MTSTLMSLESLHFLLQHMEANRRFEIRQRCPALREFEKTVPLKINSLVLTGNRVVVNDTTYKLGIVQKCKVGETPRQVAARNETGGAEYELDAYGIIDESDSRTVTPGDVALNQHEEPFVRDDNLHIAGLEQTLQNFEQHLADEPERRPRVNREAVDIIEQTIERARLQLFDHRCRRDNIPSRYNNFIQLTKTRTVDEQEQKTFERYKHNKKFSEAMKQMATILFGGRSSTIYVTKIGISFFMSSVIRLPNDLKLHIEQLVFCANSRTSVGVLAPILQESSFPLKKLEIGVWSDKDATNPMVETARILKIRDISTNIPHAISSILNRVIYINMYTLPEETLKDLVANYIASNRPIGNSHIFDFYYEPLFPEDMEQTLKELNGVIIDEENVIIPMSNSTQIKVSYGSFPEFAPRSKWAVRFLTEAIEH